MTFNDLFQIIVIEFEVLQKFYFSLTCRSVD